MSYQATLADPTWSGQSPAPKPVSSMSPIADHYCDCPGHLADVEAAVDQRHSSIPAVCPGCTECLSRLPQVQFSLRCGNPNCEGCQPRLSPPPLACTRGAPSCPVTNGSLPLPGCSCPMCSGTTPRISTGIKQATETMKGRDSIVADGVAGLTLLDRLMDDLNIRRVLGENMNRKVRGSHMRQHRLRTENHRSARSMAGISVYPPWNIRSPIIQGSRPSTTVPNGENGPRYQTMRDSSRILMEYGQERRGMEGDKCPSEDRTCSGERGERSQVPGSRTLPSGCMFAPKSVPIVPMLPTHLSGPNTMWPDRMFTPPAVPMVMLAPPNTPGRNTMWTDRMFAPRTGPVPFQRQHSVNMQSDCEASRNTKRDHERADESLRYLQHELAREEQQVATLKADLCRMIGEGLENEEKIVKLGRKLFLQLDTEARVRASKQELAVARSHLVAARKAPEEAGHDHRSFERHDHAGEQGSVKGSEKKEKEVAHDDVRQHAEEHESESTPTDALDNDNLHPMSSDGSRICRDCGGLAEASGDEGGQNDEASIVV